VAAASLTFSPLVNLLVKKPAVGVMLGRAHLQPAVSTWPLWFAALVLLVVGISEEAIKLLPLLAPEVRRLLGTYGSAEPLAFAIGLGFAVG
jgi:RsiW-degrading membrane proteinase PrsW (M82 family)